MKKVVIFLCLYSTYVAASEQELFYNLHQTYRAFESMSKGTCNKGKDIGHFYLKNADKSLGKLISNKKTSVLEPSLHKLRKLWKSKQVSVLDIHSVRNKVRNIADRLKLFHDEKRWYAEVSSRCGKVN
jgi:hypothetical protein